MSKSFSQFRVDLFEAVGAGSADVTITRKQLDILFEWLNRFFNKLQMNIFVTHHLVNQVNLPRNNPPLKLSEIQKALKSWFDRYGASIRKRFDNKSQGEIEAIVKSVSTDINIPIAVSWDQSGKFLRLRPITVMRKKVWHKRPGDFLYMVENRNNHK